MKKITLSLIFIFHIYFITAQPDTWTSKANIIGHGRMAGAGFSIGNKGFVGMGTDFNAAQSQLKDFWEYDPATDSYSQIADYPGGGVNGAGTFSIGDKGYVSCGAGNGNFYNDLWAYDTLTNSWTQKTSLPGAVRDYTVGFAINGKGYIATGYDGSQNMGDVWEYDPVSDSWTSRMGILPARSSAAGFSIGNKGYIATGYVNGGTLDCWEFDPLANTWTQKADVSNIPRSDGVGFSVGDYGYVCCGYGINYPDSDCCEYDAAQNTWTQRTSMCGAGRANPVAFTIGMKGYVFGGSDATIKALADMYEYSPDTAIVNSISIPGSSGNDWNIYPNPCKDKVVIGSVESAISKIEIYNARGEKVFKFFHPHELDISKLDAGIYIVVPDGNKKLSKKLVIE